MLRIIRVTVTKEGVATQLYQFSSGLEGRTLANGIKVIGREEAIKAEMQGVWGNMRGVEGDEMRRKVRKLKEVIRLSWETGEARKNLERLGRVIMGQ